MIVYPQEFKRLIANGKQSEALSMTEAQQEVTLRLASKLDAKVGFVSCMYPV